jgi:hypothetical protein
MYPTSLYFQQSARKFSSDWGDLAQQGIDLALTVATPKKLFVLRPKIAKAREMSA